MNQDIQQSTKLKGKCGIKSLKEIFELEEPIAEYLLPNKIITLTNSEKDNMSLQFAEAGKVSHVRDMVLEKFTF